MPIGRLEWARQRQFNQDLQQEDQQDLLHVPFFESMALASQLGFLIGLEVSVVSV